MTFEFQAGATAQGRQFADQCETLLRSMGFELSGLLRLREVGVEVDCAATSPRGNLVWFEFKGSVQGTRPGLRRTDTMKKAIANGALVSAIDAHPPFVLLASHLPVAGSGMAMLQTARRLGTFDDVICLYDPDDVRRLRAL